MDSVNVYSRQAKGVKVINPSKGDKVVSVNPVAAADDEEDEILLDEDGNPIEVSADEASEGAEETAAAEESSEVSEVVEGSDEEPVADADETGEQE